MIFIVIRVVIIPVKNRGYFCGVIRSNKNYHHGKCFIAMINRVVRSKGKLNMIFLKFRWRFKEICQA